MKKALIILFLLMLISAVLFFNYIETADKIKGSAMSEIQDTVTKGRDFPENKSEQEEAVIPQLFPEVYNVSSLKIDNKLPVLSFKNFQDTIRTGSNSINLSVELNKKIKKADIFLYVDSDKKDMYYQSIPGIYQFKNINLKKGENLVEFFYRAGGRRSQSVYTVVIKE